MKIGVVLQARMGSQRFPGKVLSVLDGEPMLCQILKRLRKAQKPSLLIVATTRLPADDVIARTATQERAELFRGAEVDLLDRYWQAAVAFELDHIVRATADNPLVDFEALDELVDLHLATNADYSTALTEWNSGFPVGTGVEVFTRTCLEQSWRDGTLPHHREHVNEYVKQHAHLFQIEVLTAPLEKEAPNLCLTIDTPQDLAFVRRLVGDISQAFTGLDLREVVNAWKMQEGTAP